ncbi:MAG: hypothetical protein ACLU4K_10765 [Oscillospiraceae bacterium]
MKAKKITAACMAAGLALMGTAGVVSYAAGNPYENYKSAVVNTISEDNLTVNAAVQMKQYGKVIASGNSVYEKSAGVQYASVVADVAGQNMIQEEYSDCNIKVKSDGSRYTEKSRKEKRDENEMLTPNMIKLAEMTADLFVGDLSNQFVSHGDTISVSLTDVQIPEIANVAASAFTEMNAGTNNENGKNDLGDILLQEFPITQNARIESVTMDADIAKGNLSAQNMTIVISGQTSDGKDTQIDITINANVSDIGSTTPQMIDTSSLQKSSSLENENDD